jgi:hypothetical protein
VTNAPDARLTNAIPVRTNRGPEAVQASVGP